MRRTVGKRLPAKPYPKTGLNDSENEFIKFLARHKARPVEEIKTICLETRLKILFYGATI